MKWIEPENGGIGDLINLANYDLIQRVETSNNKYRIEFIHFDSIHTYFEYSSILSRNADFERIRCIALGISDDAEEKPSENYDPYEVDWSKIPDECDYVATDADGWCNAYDKLPSIYQDAGWVTHRGAYKSLGIIEYNPDWRNSLRIRPGTDKANA